MTTDEQALANIAANLSRLLADRKWSQSDLARAAGEAIVNINRAVRGVNMPGAGLLGRIAEALDVSVDRLLADPPQRNFQKSA